MMKGQIHEEAGNTDKAREAYNQGVSQLFRSFEFYLCSFPARYLNSSESRLILSNLTPGLRYCCPIEKFAGRNMSANLAAINAIYVALRLQ